MSGLAELLDRVQKANGANIDLDVDLECAAPQPDYVVSIRPSNVRGKVIRIYGSTGRAGVAGVARCTFCVDDALRFASRMLPDHDYLLGNTNGGLTIHAQFGPNRDDMGFGENLALAIVAGTLKAKIALLAKAN